MILDLMYQMVNDLNKTTSSNEKISILKKYDKPEIKTLLKYIYDTKNYVFGITSKSILNNPNLKLLDPETNIFYVLEILAERQATGHNAIALVNSLINYFPFYKELILNIIDRSLKCRIDISLINKAFPVLIKEFDVALAESYFDKNRNERKIDFENEDWYASHKMDGCRCITIIDQEGKVSCFSREGKEFFTLDALKTNIKKLNLKGIVLDGEICKINPETGEENFQDVMKEIRRKDHTIQTPKYKVFDFLTMEEFYSKTSEYTLTERYKILYITIKKDNPSIDIVEQIKINDRDHLLEIYDKANELGWEGIIARKDTCYKGKRSWDLLKLKEVYDAEYKVISVSNGPIRFIKNGNQVEEEMLSEVTIQHKGANVGVGSGFSIDQRRYFFVHPEEIINRIITVTYTQESTDQNGKPSLRFPRFKVLHGNRRTL